MIFDKMKCCIIKLLGGYTAEEFIHCAMFHPDDTVGKRVQELIQIIRCNKKLLIQCYPRLVILNRRIQNEH